MNTTKPTRDHLRKIALFLLICLLLQGGICFAVSEPFSAWLYRADARLHAERISLDDGGVLEYYFMREALADAQLIAVGCDSGVSGTAVLLLDLLEFIKQSAEVSLLVVDLDEDIVRRLNILLSNDGEFSADVLASVSGATNETLQFFAGLAELNDRLPPSRKISLLSSARSWSVLGKVKNPVLYLADRALGADDMQTVARRFVGREGLLTIDLRYQNSFRLADMGVVEALNEIDLPFVGREESIWAYDTELLSRTAAYYDLVVDRIHGGRLRDNADRIPLQGGRFNLVLVGGVQASSLSVLS